MPKLPVRRIGGFRPLQLSDPQSDSAVGLSCGLRSGIVGDLPLPVHELRVVLAEYHPAGQVVLSGWVVGARSEAAAETVGGTGCRHHGGDGVGVGGGGPAVEGVAELGCEGDVAGRNLVAGVQLEY